MSHKSHGMHGNPDKGPQMHEGEHHYDKGYTSNAEAMSGGSYGDHERGNDYMRNSDKYRHSDLQKLHRNKFTKVA